jgi:hypothetical protein
MDDQGNDVVNSYNLNSWMSDLHSVIGHLRVSELSLAGSHNCGMDGKAPYVFSHGTCQDDSFLHQLNNGIRVFDIRLMWYWGYGEYNIGVGLKFYHGDASGRTFADMMKDVDQFHQSQSQELVIFDFHSIEAQNPDKAIPFDLIHAHFTNNYGTRLLPRSAVLLTLGEIKAQYPGRNIVLMGPYQLWEKGRDRTYFWPKPWHEWHGRETASNDDVRSFIAGVMSNPPFKDYPWSTSATGYNSIIGPTDIIDHISDWYPTGGDWQRKTNILNFDWVSRKNSKVIRQCIESNITKPASHVFEITKPVPEEVVYGKTVVVTGSGEPGAMVVLGKEGAGGNFGEGQVNAEGVWKIETDLIPAGTFGLTCLQERNGRNSSWAFTVWFGHIDKYPAPDLHFPSYGATVGTLRPEIKGVRGVTNATVRLYVNTIHYGSGAVVANGNWGIQLTRDLPLGKITLEFDQILSGNVSDLSLPVEITVTQKPAKPRIGEQTMGPNWVSFSVLRDTDVASYIYSLNGGPARTTASSYIKFENLLPDTRYSTDIIAVNNLGVQSDVATFQLEYNPVAAPPHNLHVVSNAGRAVTIAWSSPQTEEKLIGYYVKIIKQEGLQFEASYTARFLLVGILTIFQVQAVYGGGRKSEWVNIGVIPKA